MKIRVGLVGLGDQWNTRHCPALKALTDRFEVKAICCEIADRSRSIAEEFGAIPLDGFRAMIEREDIDAILALAPDWAGPIPILAACEAGKAIYSSAALDISPDQLTQIRERVDRSGVAFMAELPRRHSPATIRLKELMATRLGPARLLFCHERLAVEKQSDRLRRGDYCPLVWRNFMEQVDWCRYLIGAEPVNVTSSIHEQHDEHKDIYYQMASLTFESSNGQSTAPLAQLSIGHYIPERWQNALSYRRPASVQVCCENGMAFIDLPSTLVWFDEGGEHTESLEADRAVGEQMLCQFHRAVTSLVRKTTDLEDAYRALTVVLSAQQSAESGRRIQLNFES